MGSFKKFCYFTSSCYDDFCNWVSVNVVAELCRIGVFTNYGMSFTVVHYDKTKVNYREREATKAIIISNKITYVPEIIRLKIKVVVTIITNFIINFVERKVLNNYDNLVNMRGYTPIQLNFSNFNLYSNSAIINFGILCCSVNILDYFLYICCY